jgi:hypothetical protein
MNIRCPICRKKVAVPDEEAGMIALCPACGTNYRVPDLPAPAPASPAATLEPDRSFRWLALLLWIGGGVVLLAAAGALSWALYNRHVAQQAQLIAHATELNAQAESEIAGDKVQQAQATLSNLENLIVGHEQPELKGMVADVRRDLTARRAADANPP